MYSPHCSKVGKKGFLTVWGKFKDKSNSDMDMQLQAFRICCSNKQTINLNRKCNSNYTFSTYSTYCKACGDIILQNDIITVNTNLSENNEWVHCHCANIEFESKKNDNEIQCLKCLQQIYHFQDKVESVIFDTNGYVHVKCPTLTDSRDFPRTLAMTKGLLDLVAEDIQPIKTKNYENIITVKDMTDYNFDD